MLCVCLQLLEAAFDDAELRQFLVRENIEPFRGFGGVCIPLFYFFLELKLAVLVVVMSRFSSYDFFFLLFFPVCVHFFCNILHLVA